MSLGPLVFLSPWLLAGLLVLPVLWWLLRATPPAPRHLKFPAVRLLLGLYDPEKIADKTPLWLLLLRMLALAAAIVAFAEPVLDPDPQAEGNGPLLVVMDGGWASAPDWAARVQAAESTLEQAARRGRPTVFVSLARPLPQGAGLPFRGAGDWLAELRGLEPQPWAPDRAAFADWLAARDGNFDTWWLTDGLSYEASGLAAALGKRGAVQVVDTARSPLALLPLSTVDGRLSTTVVGVSEPADRALSLKIFGTAPNGIPVALARADALLKAGKPSVTVPFDIPLELRNRTTRVTLEGNASAASVALAGDGLRRRKVALIGTQVQEGPQLVSPLFYLQKALQPSVVLLRADLTDSLLAAPDVIILADVGTLSDSSASKLQAWVEQGGLLLRFAGPRLVASASGTRDDPLLPVRLRTGGRSLGGAMSWNTPKRLQPFAANSPFSGLPVPDDVTVSAQVVAQPAPDLAGRTLAALEDGTPLVTARDLGKGRVVLFHVTANAEWSTLPLSGLFVQMLERLSVSSSGAGAMVDLAGRDWIPEQVLDGFGRLAPPENPVPVSGERLLEPVAADAPPGLYRAGEEVVAIDVLRAGDRFEALDLPAGTPFEILGERRTQAFKPPLLLMALSLLLLDILATLRVTGRLRNSGTVQALGLLALVTILPFGEARAGTDELALRAANETVLAYVRTGDPNVDRISAAGLRGLGLVLFRRTSIEPAAPIGVDVEADELGFFPLLYWPLTEGQQALSPAASERVNRYLSSGGMILFDTRDAGQGVAGANTQALQRLTASLDIPPLEPVPQDHVLTRAFYLLQDFPGRWAKTPVWVEVSTPAPEGGRFANINDGVSPVIIGGNDWAAAWAVDADNRPMFPIGRGLAGNRQREMARRFGVNLVMYVMTGNYKSDQVHVPALLERLGE